MLLAWPDLSRFNRVSAFQPCHLLEQQIRVIARVTQTWHEQYGTNHITCLASLNWRCDSNLRETLSHGHEEVQGTPCPLRYTAANQIKADSFKRNVWVRNALAVTSHGLIWSFLVFCGTRRTSRPFFLSYTIKENVKKDEKKRNSTPLHELISKSLETLGKLGILATSAAEFWCVHKMWWQSKRGKLSEPESPWMDLAGQNDFAEMSWVSESRFQPEAPTRLSCWIGKLANFELIASGKALWRANEFVE